MDGLEHGLEANLPSCANLPISVRLSFPIYKMEMSVPPNIPTRTAFLQSVWIL